ncbi:MAG: hypothetical protein H7Y37_08660 [Anaerolineae bacterium]|nr:hypothetical protein [Gloeobacterales cyanobacterium ES-bin-313]
MISPFIILCVAMVAVTALAVSSYNLNRKRMTHRRALPIQPRTDAPKTREEIIAMLERQFNNSPSGPPERNL